MFTVEALLEKLNSDFQDADARLYESQNADLREGRSLHNPSKRSYDLVHFILKLIDAINAVEEAVEEDGFVTYESRAEANWSELEEPLGEFGGEYDLDELSRQVIDSQVIGGELVYFRCVTLEKFWQIVEAARIED